MSLVLGIDIAALRGTVIAQPVQKVLDRVFHNASREITSRCGVDPMAKARSLVIAGQVNGIGAAYIELSATASDVIGCLETLLPDSDVTRRGDMILVVEDGDTEAAFGWVDGVLVVPLRDGRAEDGKRGLAILERMMRGPGVAKDAILIRGLRDVSTSATAWMIWGDRMEWDGRDLDEPRRTSALMSPTLVAQDASVEEEEYDVPAARRDDDRRATMLYATGQLDLANRPRLQITGRFKADGDWVRDSLDRQLQKEARELRNLGVTPKVTASNNRVVLTAELPSASALSSLIEMLD